MVDSKIIRKVHVILDHPSYYIEFRCRLPDLNNDAKRRVYGKNLAKKQKCSVPCSVLFSSRYIDEKKIFRQRFVSSSG